MKVGIRVKLFGGFGVVLALLCGVGAIGFKNTTDFSTHFQDLYEVRLKSVEELSASQQALYELRLGAAGANYGTASAEQRTATKAKDEKWLAQISDSMRRLESVLSGEERSTYDNWATAYAGFLKSRQQVIDLVDQGNTTEAAAMRSGDYTKRTQQVVEGVQTLMQFEDRTAQAMAIDTGAMADLSVRALLFAVFAALVVGLGVAFVLSRQVTRGVRDVQRALTSLTDNCATLLENGLAAMSRSDLSVEAHAVTEPIQRYGDDEIGQTALVTNQLIARLHGTITSYERARAGLGALVGEVRSAADGVAKSSSQLGISANQAGAAVQQVTTAMQNMAAGAHDTSRGAQETKAAVGQLAQAIQGIARGASEQASQVAAAHDTANEMADGVNHVAVTAEQVATASSETRKAAEHGGLAVRETTAAMAEIQHVVGEAAGTVEELGKLGTRIGAVVETIDDIAAQTNLLALNAAIEAARAGEHGRGFAVVADEVRKLAERSSRETQQIADLIKQVQAGTQQAVKAMQAGAAKVDQGSQKADLAGHALEAILAAVDHTVRQAKDIASASQGMAVGARQVTDAMASISAIVEENTAATEQMSAQSGQVAQAIESIAAVSQEQSAGTEEVSASAEEMSAQIEEMSAQAQELSSTAEQLRQLVALFQLDASVPTDASAPDAPAAAHHVVPLPLLLLRRAA